MECGLRCRVVPWWPEGLYIYIRRRAYIRPQNAWLVSTARSTPLQSVRSRKCSPFFGLQKAQFCLSRQWPEPDGRSATTRSTHTLQNHILHSCHREGFTHRPLLLVRRLGLFDPPFDNL